MGRCDLADVQSTQKNVNLPCESSDWTGKEGVGWQKEQSKHDTKAEEARTVMDARTPEKDLQLNSDCNEPGLWKRLAGPHSL